MKHLYKFLFVLNFYGLVLGQTAHISFSEVNPDSGKIYLSYSSDTDIYGFQMHIDGVTVSDAISTLPDCVENAENGGVACVDIPDDLDDPDVMFLPSGDGMLVEISFELPGDVSLDGNQDILDVIIIVQLILDNYNPSPMAEFNADVDGNGAVELYDIIILLDLILDISSFVY